MAEKWQELLNFGKCKCLHTRHGNLDVSYKLEDTVLGPIYTLNFGTIIVVLLEPKIKLFIGHHFNYYHFHRICHLVRLLIVVQYIGPCYVSLSNYFHFI